MQMRCTKSCLVLVGLALLATLLVSPAWAAEESTNPDTAAQPSATVAPADAAIPATIAGVQIAIDPATGRLRQPTPEEAKALAEAFQKAFGTSGVARKTVVRKDANGMLTAELDFSLFDHLEAEIRPDGSIATRCVPGTQPTDAQPQNTPEDR